MIRSSTSQLSNKIKNKRKNKRKNKWISYLLVEKLQIWIDWVVREAPRPQPNLIFAQFSVVCMFNWMLGQLRRVMGRSYIRGRAPNLNRLSRARKNIKNLALNLIQCSCNSQSCVCSIGCSTNWGRAVGRSFLEGRSYVRGRAPNLNRLSNMREKV